MGAGAADGPWAGAGPRAGAGAGAAFAAHTAGCVNKNVCWSKLALFQTTTLDKQCKIGRSRAQSQPHPLPEGMAASGYHTLAPLPFLGTGAGATAGSITNSMQQHCTADMHTSSKLAAEGL